MTLKVVSVIWNHS